jgi:CheY-like chemotaxis protein
LRTELLEGLDSDVDAVVADSAAEAAAALADADCVVVDDTMPGFGPEDMLDALAKRAGRVPAADRGLPRRTRHAPGVGSPAWRIRASARRIRWRRLRAHLAFWLHRSPGVMSDRDRSEIETALDHSFDLRGKKALIVDDDMRNIFALATVLDEVGMVIVSADNGRDAIRLVESDPAIDIVLMDIMMPEMDGLTTNAPDPRPAARARVAAGGGDSQGDERRPPEMHRSRCLGLPVQAGRSDAPAGRAAGLAVLSAGAGSAMTEPADKVDILVVDDLQEKLLVFKTVLEEPTRTWCSCVRAPRRCARC